ncbi:DNA gyrase inhibitor YacG [Atopomonas sediminilitoris]|uniref:DNA gyrase inhibitor YacG n=1 Tax=Atopomonas sediminilitoris TaxID=2919919 RepID=UPI001F4E2230|nr:DNA gyrase inhibitor YacG [Atopomonas sediminilitoris]MCJ8168479.1 DNA gyrase inhibitor YacG [Atopomonas sediminilitoris]
MTAPKAPTLVDCPTCKKPVAWSSASPFRPFCCKRCQLIDLGAWAAEEHAIAGKPAEEELFSEDWNKLH